jgi:RHS repeat-associated protein
VLWSQSYPGNSSYLSSVSNGMGLAESFTWALARNNFYGAPSGSSPADPMVCANTSIQSSFPCNMPDNQTWSRAVLTQRSDATNGVTSNWNYTYQVQFPLAAQECSGCVASFYWGNQNDNDELDFYNNTFMGFAQAVVSNPDGSMTTHRFLTTQGFGLYDLGQAPPLHCDEPAPCHNDPYWALGNAAHGHEYEVDQTDNVGTALLSEERTQWAAICPPATLGGTPSNSNYGNWDGDLVTELDHSNPVMVCDIQRQQVDDLTLDGATQGPVPDKMTTYRYDSFGRVTGQNSIETTAVFDSSGAGNHATWRGGVSFGQPGLVSGSSDTAASLDGSTGEIDTDYVQSPVSAYSVEAWVKTTDGGTRKAIVNDRGSGGGGQSLTLQLSGGKPYFELESNFLEIGVIGPTAINDGQPHHLVGTWSGTAGSAVAPSQFTLYVDGSAVSTTTVVNGSATAPVAGSGGTKIGRHEAWGTNLNGTVDEVAIYQGALTAAQVQAHHTAGAGYQTTILQDHPVAYYRLDDGTVGTNAGPTTIEHNTAYIQNNGVTTSSTSALGPYLIDYPAFDDIEDTNGNRFTCHYTSYDGAVWNSGQQTSLTRGELTTSFGFAGCGTPANNFSDQTGASSTHHTYDGFGNLVTTTDPDASASVPGHTGCTVGGTASTACTSFDGTYDTLPVATGNALNQGTATGYPSSPYAAAGFGLWPISQTDANQQATTTGYDALGRVVTTTLPPASGACPTGWSCADIGSPVQAGRQGLNGGTWTIQGAGGDIWGTADQFHYVWQTLSGDGSVSARVVSQDRTDAWAKAGVMLRQTSDPASAYYAVEVTPANTVVIQYRASSGAAATWPTSIIAAAPEYVRASRSGSTFSAYVSSDGTNWTLVPGSTVGLNVSGSMLAGLAVTSHDTAAVSTVTMDSVAVASSGTSSCPNGWSCADIGSPAQAGGQSLSGTTWTVQGEGADIWGTSDQFHYVWQSLAGDGTITARVSSQTNTSSWAKAGVMLRQSTDPASAYYAVEVTPGNGIVVQYRASSGATAAWPSTVSGAAPMYVRAVRTGTSFSAYTSSDGVGWTLVPSSTVTLSVSGAMLSGLEVTSHDAANMGSATFDGVSMITACPAPWSCADIGSPAQAGSQILNGGSWSIQGEGSDIWGTSDQFHYVSQTLAGDGSLMARVVGQTNTDPWAKAGIMLRQSSDPASAYYAVEVTPGNGIVVQYRPSSGASAVWTATQSGGTLPAYVEAVRTGTTFSAATSTDGVNWTYLSGSTAVLGMTGALQAGLEVTSHNTSTMGVATFDTVILSSVPSMATNAAAYTVWCSGTGSQTPCVEVDKTQRLSSTTTVTSRSFYDGLGRLVETRSPAPGGQDIVQYATYDAGQRLAFKSVPYFVSAYTGGPGSAAYATPDTTQAGTIYDSTQNNVVLGRYDGLGRLRVSTDALSHKSTTNYSVVCAPAGTGDPGCFEQTLTVDANGHEAGTLVDALGRTAYVQRYTGNSSSTYALYATARYTYDFAGDLVRILEPDGSTQATFGYDMLGRKTSLSDPDLGAQTYTYDQNGNLTESVDARGAAGTIFMGYDGLNRPIWRNTSNSPTGAYDTYAYDSTAGGNVGVGRLTSEAFAVGSLSGSEAYTYDNRGQQTNTTLTVGGATYPLGSTYDDAGNVLTQSYPDGETITNGYTAQGWLSQVATSQGGTTLASNLAYTGVGGALGDVTGASLGNGTYTYSATYDLLDRATDLKTTKTSGGTVMFDQSRTFDSAGNVTGTSMTMPGGTDNQVFCYDEQDRLVGAGHQCSYAGGGLVATDGTLTAAIYTQTFAYDVMGRLTSGPLGTYSYGNSAHIHAATGIGSAYTATYDAAGNMTCRASSSSSTCAGTQTGAQLGYNNEGELQAWQNAPSSPTSASSFLYDGQGQRVEQVVTQSGTTTSTVYVGDAEEMSTTGGTTTTTAYYYAGGKRIGLSVNGTTSYLASDGLGSSTVTLSSTGSATAAQLFTPYGSVLYSSGTMPTPYGFTGQRSDATSGLDYYGSRYYDPVAGQFAQADSVMPGGGYEPWDLSRYAYVGGNPVARVDPTGHSNQTGPGGAGCPFDPSCTPPQSGPQDGPPDGGPSVPCGCGNTTPPYFPPPSASPPPPPPPSQGPVSGPSNTPVQIGELPGAIVGAVRIGAPVVISDAAAAALGFVSILAFPLITPCDNPPCNGAMARAGDLPLDPGTVPVGGRVYIPPKAGHGKPVSQPHGSGFVDDRGNVWEWARDEHAGPHWDVQHEDGSHTNVAPNGKVIGEDNFPNSDSLKK